MRPKPLIAVVDDDEIVRETTKDLLQSAGFSAATFPSAESLLDSKRLDRVCCLIADMRMPGMSGLALHQQLVAANRSIPTILVSAYLDERLAAQALKARVVCCLSKPIGAAELLTYVRRILRRQG